MWRAWALVQRLIFKIRWSAHQVGRRELTGWAWARCFWLIFSATLWVLFHCLRVVLWLWFLLSCESSSWQKGVPGVLQKVRIGGDGEGKEEYMCISAGDKAEFGLQILSAPSDSLFIQHSVWFASAKLMQMSCPYWVFILICFQGSYMTRSIQPGSLVGCLRIFPLIICWPHTSINVPGTSQTARSPVLLVDLSWEGDEEL